MSQYNHGLYALKGWIDKLEVIDITIILMISDVHEGGISVCIVAVQNRSDNSQVGRNVP